MTLQAIAPIWWPEIPGAIASIAAHATAITFDNGADRYAMIFQAPKAGDLDRMELMIGAVTTWPTNGVKFGWQGVTETSTPAIPNGTYSHSVTVTSAPTANTWYAPSSFVDGGAAKRTVTKGEVLSFVVAPANSGDTTSFTLLRLDWPSSSGLFNGFPLAVANTTGSYGFSGRFVPCALFYSGESDPVIVSTYCLPCGSSSVPTTTQAISSANPKYAGMVFHVPYSCKVDGMWVVADTDAIESALICTTDATTPLASSTWDADRRADAGSNLLRIQFTAEVTLSVNTNYRLILKNSVSGTTCLLRYWVFATGTPNYGAAYGLGSTAKLTTSNDGTTWSDTTGSVPLMGLRISGLDDGAGGGGGGGPLIGGRLTR